MEAEAERVAKPEYAFRFHSDTMRVRGLAYQIKWISSKGAAGCADHLRASRKCPSTDGRSYPRTRGQYPGALRRSANRSSCISRNKQRVRIRSCRSRNGNSLKLVQFGTICRT